MIQINPSTYLSHVFRMTTAVRNIAVRNKLFVFETMDPSCIGEMQHLLMFEMVPCRWGNVTNSHIQNLNLDRRIYAFFQLFYEKIKIIRFLYFLTSIFGAGCFRNIDIISYWNDRKHLRFNYLINYKFKAKETKQDKIRIIHQNLNEKFKGLWILWTIS